MLKVYLKTIMYMLIILIGSTLILTILSYFNIINNKFITIFKFIIPFVSFFFSGFYLSKHSNKKGLIEGLTIGIIYVLFIMLLGLLALDMKLNFKNIIYYLILIFSSIIGGIISKKFKKNNKN